jgi:hypothetical protein
MNVSKLLRLLLGLAMLVVVYRSYGWAGVALATGVIVMVMLVRFNRAAQVLQRAANRPIGTVASAVMLNARLRPQVKLLPVIILTGSLGEPRSPQDTQPEIVRWTDAGGCFVDATFVNGELSEWKLVRPEADEKEAPAAQEANAQAAHTQATQEANAIAP